MIGNNVLLDTNVVIELFKGNPLAVDFFEPYDIVTIPFVVLGELYFGAYRSANPTKHIKQIRNFLYKCDVLSADEETADHYAIIKTALLGKGKPIPENDIWIAAIAKQYQLTLITNDRHFAEVDGVPTESL